MKATSNLDLNLSRDLHNATLAWTLTSQHLELNASSDAALDEYYAGVEKQIWRIWSPIIFGE